MTQEPDPAVRPVVFVLFGATGDLARRMVLPALYRLACGGLLPRQWLVVGNGRGDITHENFRARVHDALTEFGRKPAGKDWDSFAQRVFFAGGGFSSDPPRPPAGRARRGARIAGRQPAADALPGRPAGRVRRADTGAGPVWTGRRRPGGLRECVWHLALLSFSLAGDGQIDLFLVAKRPGPALNLDVARVSIPLASLHGAEPLLTNPPPARGYAPGSWGRPRPASSSHPGNGSWAGNHPAAAGRHPVTARIRRPASRSEAALSSRAARSAAVMSGSSICWTPPAPSTLTSDRVTS